MFSEQEYNEDMKKSPEQKAIEEFEAGQAAYAKAKILAQEVIAKLQPVQFGEVAKAITSVDITSHIASQAIDSMMGREVNDDSVGRLLINNSK